MYFLANNVVEGGLDIIHVKLRIIHNSWPLRSRVIVRILPHSLLDWSFDY